MSRSRNVIYRRDGYPRSIRGRRNPVRRDGRPRSVRSQMNPEYRELRLSQRRGRKMFLFKPVWMGFCASTAQGPEQERILFAPNVEVDDNDEATTSKVQAGARKEFAGLPVNRQQRETASTEQSKQLDLRGRWRRCLLSAEKGFHCSLFCPYVLYFSLLFFCLVRKADTRGEDNYHSRIREQLGCKPDA